MGAVLLGNVDDHRVEQGLPLKRHRHGINGHRADFAGMQQVLKLKAELFVGKRALHVAHDAFLVSDVQGHDGHAAPGRLVVSVKLSRRLVGLNDVATLWINQQLDGLVVVEQDAIPLLALLEGLLQPHVGLAQRVVQRPDPEASVANQQAADAADEKGNEMLRRGIGPVKEERLHGAEQTQGQSAGEESNQQSERARHRAMALGQEAQGAKEEAVNKKMVS